MGKSRITGMGILLLILLVISLIISACSKAPETAVKPTGPAKVKVGLVFDVGGRGDKSFNDGAFAGLEAARAKDQDGLSLPLCKAYHFGKHRCRIEINRLFSAARVNCPGCYCFYRIFWV